MKIFAYGFVLKSTKQLQSASKQKDLAFGRLHSAGHTAQSASIFIGSMAWPLCNLIKTNIGDRQCLSRLFTRGWCLQTSSFLGLFSWRRCRIQALIFAISMRCQNIFWYQRFAQLCRCSGSNMSAMSTPPMLLLYC